MSTICLDFDGVVHSYVSGWKGATIIPDAPVPMTKRAIELLRMDYEVKIFSSRCGQEGGSQGQRRAHGGCGDDGRFWSCSLQRDLECVSDFSDFSGPVCDAIESIGDLIFVCWQAVYRRRIEPSFALRSGTISSDLHRVGRATVRQRDYLWRRYFMPGPGGQQLL